jgi:hypothetical protein
MKKHLLIFSFLLLLTAPAFSQETTLWFWHPATEWTGALPVGNGRLGAGPDVRDVGCRRLLR